MSAYSLPYSVDPLAFAAKKIIEDNLSALPKLNHCIVLLPNYQVASTMRKELLKAAKNNGFNTLIGPKVFLFRDYILKNTYVSNQQFNSTAAELLIIQSLNENRSLFGDNNTLSSSYALLELINELTRHQVVLPSNFHSFKQQLLNAYETKSREFDALSHEAKLVYTIWQAWHSQLQSLNKIDKESLYQLKLGQNHTQTKDVNFYLVGSQNFSPSESKWLQQKLNANSLTIFAQCEGESTDIHPDTFSTKLFKSLNISPNTINTSDARNNFLTLIFSKNQSSLKKRVETAKTLYPKSPLSSSISIYQSNAFEDEANAIQIQIRRWLQEGKKDIAFVSEDRRLARRVRALLERYGIGLHDSEGWALSTSSAASIIESLLEAIEDNFGHTALLTLVKSPYLFSQDQKQNKATNKLEQEIVQHEKIYNDIERYKKALSSRHKRLNIESNEDSEHLVYLLDSINNATKSLQHLHTQERIRASDFVKSVSDCLTYLHAKDNFENDSAGKVILDLLGNILNATESCDTELSWTELRQWFAKKLEETTFTVNTKFKTQIKLLHLHQSNLSRHEAIIFGSLTREYLPGAPPKSPFFNYQVYQELGLSNSHETLQERFFYFRRLLSAADQILLTYHSGEQEEQVSPWLELLNNFHQLTYAEKLQDEVLEKLVEQSAQFQYANSANDISHVKITENLLPKRISASAHQTLIDCPYSYFLSEVIKLRAPEEIRLTLAKSDYGERIHNILFLFHQGGDNKSPPPFSEKISESNRESAITRLIEISQAVFHSDLEDNFQHRGWLKRWLETIPFYIDWQIQEQPFWSYYQGEISSSHPLSNGIDAYGRIDRIDNNSNSNRVIDYKTGNYPKKTEIESGESVQLIHYALSLTDKTSELAYLSLQNKGKTLTTDTILDEENLNFVQNATEQRLVKILDEIKSGENMSAWGDDKTCSYCQFAGICRERLD